MSTGLVDAGILQVPKLAGAELAEFDAKDAYLPPDLT